MYGTMVYLCKMPPVYGFQYRTFKIIRCLVLGMLLANQDTELTQDHSAFSMYVALRRTFPRRRTADRVCDEE